MNEYISYTLLIALFTASFRIATPLLLTSLGELYGEKSGILNLGMEGLMMSGTLFGFITAQLTNDPWLGVLIGILSGGLFSLVFGFLVISLGANQVVCGLALNLFISGISVFIYRLIYGTPYLLPFAQKPFKEIYIAGFSEIPFIGPVLFSQYALVYIAFFLVPILSIIMYRSYWGLKIIACGENPEVATSRGINVSLVRYWCVFFGGCMAGAGGAFLSIAQINQFFPGMVAGRGFISVVLVIFGRWSPGRILLGALLFGFIEALALQLQTLSNIPHQFLLMLPYLVTVGALFFTRKIRYGIRPTGLAKSYRAGES